MDTLFVISLFSIDVPHTEERMDDHFIQNITFYTKNNFNLYEHNLISFRFYILLNNIYNSIEIEINNQLNKFPKFFFLFRKWK